MHVAAGDTTNLSQEKLNQFVAGAYDAYQQKLLPHLATAVVLELVEVVQYLDQVDVLEAVHTGAGTGGDTGFGLPSSIALVVSWKIPAHYRGGHPRTYLTGLVADRTADNRHWTTDTVTEFTAAATDFHTEMNNVAIQSWGAGSALVSIQRFVNGGSQQVPKVYLDPPRVHFIFGREVHPRIDSQRRRLGKETT